MNRKLTPDQIEAACRDLLSRRRRVTVRAVMAELRNRHDATGRTERIREILHRLAAGPTFESPLNPPAAADTTLLERLKTAEARAARAEELERVHQEFWAKRYAEKADELERKYAGTVQSRPAITADQHLRLRQRIAELTRRLAQYEPVEP